MLGGMRYRRCVAIALWTVVVLTACGGSAGGDDRRDLRRDYEQLQERLERYDNVGQIRGSLLIDEDATAWSALYTAYLEQSLDDPDGVCEPWMDALRELNAAVLAESMNEGIRHVYEGRDLLEKVPAAGCW